MITQSWFDQKRLFIVVFQTESITIENYSDGFLPQ